MSVLYGVEVLEALVVSARSARRTLSLEGNAKDIRSNCLESVLHIMLLFKVNTGLCPWLSWQF